MDIINSINDLIQFIIPGCLFLSVRNFISGAKREEHEQFLIIKCVSWSFVIPFIANLIKIDKLILKLKFLNITQCNQDFIVSIIAAILFGVILGYLMNVNWVQKAISLVFRRTTEENEFVWLWKDYLKERRCLDWFRKWFKKEKPRRCVRFSMKDDEEIYYIGKIEKVFSAYSDPSILFTYYDVYKKDGSKVENEQHGKDKNYKMIIRYADIKKIDLIPVPKEKDKGK